MSKLTKMILLPVSLTLGLAGCMGIGPNKNLCVDHNFI